MTGTNAANETARPELLVVAPLMPFLMEALRRDYTVHDRIHVSDPAAFATVAPRIGVVGMGRIGQAIAQRASAFKMDIAYTARSPRANVNYTYYPDAVSLAAAVDFLVVITPGGAGTRGLIDARVLAALGPEGYLI